MAHINVSFTYHTGITRDLFDRGRLLGSWDASGMFSSTFSEEPMSKVRGDDGCAAFVATVKLDDSQVGRRFQWAVLFDTSSGPNRRAILTEVQDVNSTARHREFVLQAGGQHERYYLTNNRRLGAQKFFPNGRPNPALRCAVWAPHAQNVELVFGKSGAASTGYIADDGHGVDPALGPFPMVRGADGVWETDLARSPELDDYARFAQKPYMFRVTNEQGQVTFKTDLYSRRQVGGGHTDPNGAHYNGPPGDLDGTVSCSIVIDPDLVAERFEDTGWPQVSLQPADVFWLDEFVHGLTPSQRLQDMTTYEVHLGSLGFGDTRHGDFDDAIALVPHLKKLGVNAVELLPVMEFEGALHFGYGTSHFMAPESSAGSRDQVKHFVWECHRHGLAVLVDVVFNHYSQKAGRAQWGFDSNPDMMPEHNNYYWYEGRRQDHVNTDGGYLDNESSGFAPRYWEEQVRQLFISSAAMLIDEFHFDGLRVDLTQAFHRDNRLHADGRNVSSANIFGQKLLRELNRTVKMINPKALVIAEDHTGWEAVTQSPDSGGLGFDATWDAEFCHHLVGDGNRGSQYARLIHTCGFGQDGPLAITTFGHILNSTSRRKVVYQESHDEAGNGENTARTIVVASNHAPLIGDTRRFAEARCRFAYGMTMLSAAAPLFLMGEEIGAAKGLHRDTFSKLKEDLVGDSSGIGRFLFRFYQDLNKLRTLRPSVRDGFIDVIYTHDANRVIAFRRGSATEDLLVLASLNNRAFDRGYFIHSDRLPGGPWTEIFNSDAAAYGGDNVGNGGATIPANGGVFNAVIPDNGFVAFLWVH